MKQQNQIVNNQNNLVFHNFFSYLKVRNSLWTQVLRKFNFNLINQAKSSFTDQIAKSITSIFLQNVLLRSIQELKYKNKTLQHSVLKSNKENIKQFFETKINLKL